MVDELRVAERIAGLALDGSGHLARSAYLDMAGRGGVLVDLARMGRLGQTEDSIELDATPTGWPPADRALTELAASAEGQSLDGWLQASHLGVADLAGVLLRGGSWFPLPRHGWHVTPRYAVRDEAQRARDVALLAGTGSPGSADDAAVVCIAVAAGLAGRASAAAIDEPLAATGDLRWVCRLVVDFLGWARTTGAAVSSASQTALWSGIPF